MQVLRADVDDLQGRHRHVPVASRARRVSSSASSSRPRTSGTRTPRTRSRASRSRSGVSACPTSKPARSTGGSSASRRRRCWSPSARSRHGRHQIAGDRVGRRRLRGARPRQADHGVRHRQDVHLTAPGRADGRGLAARCCSWCRRSRCCPRRCGSGRSRPRCRCGRSRFARTASPLPARRTPTRTSPQSTSRCQRRRTSPLLTERLTTRLADTESMTVVFSTYQSIDVVARAQARGRPRPVRPHHLRRGAPDHRRHPRRRRGRVAVRPGPRRRLHPGRPSAST